MIDTGCQVTILATSVFEQMSPLVARCELCMSVAFPGLQCDLRLVIVNIGSEGLLGIEAFQSCLPHQLDLRTGQLWADGQSTLQLHQERQAFRDCSPAVVALVTYPDLAYPSLADFVCSANASDFNRFNRSFSGTWVQPAVSHGIRPLPIWFHCLSQIVSTLCTSLVQPLSQPASSNSGELIADGRLIDVSAPALSTGGQLVRPGAVPFVSCRAGAYGRLLLATHGRRLTGGLVTCDWLRPVTQGVWRVAPQIGIAAHTAVSYLGCSGWWMCLWITWAYLRSVEVLLLTWTHVLLILLWCCLTELCFFLLWTYRIARDYLIVFPCRLCQTTQDYHKNCAPVCTFTVYISCSHGVWRRSE